MLVIEDMPGSAKRRWLTFLGSVTGRVVGIVLGFGSPRGPSYVRIG